MNTFISIIDLHTQNWVSHLHEERQNIASLLNNNVYVALAGNNLTYLVVVLCVLSLSGQQLAYDVITTTFRQN